MFFFGIFGAMKEVCNLMSFQKVNVERLSLVHFPCSYSERKRRVRSVVHNHLSLFEVTGDLLLFGAGMASSQMFFEKLFCRLGFVEVVAARLR